MRWEICRETIKDGRVVEEFIKFFDGSKKRAIKECEIVDKEFDDDLYSESCLYKIDHACSICGRQMVYSYSKWWCKHCNNDHNININQTKLTTVCEYDVIVVEDSDFIRTKLTYQEKIVIPKSIFEREYVRSHKEGL